MFRHLKGGLSIANKEPLPSQIERFLVFGNKKSHPRATENNRPAASGKMGAENLSTIVTSGCHFIGDFRCSDSARINGKIDGTIVADGLLIIEEGASVVGEIAAESAIIHGCVKGNLEATGRIEFHRSARFDGDIVSPLLLISDGAVFNGHSSMPGDTVGDKGRSALVTAR